MLRDLALFLSHKIGRGILKDKSSRYKGLKQWSLEKLSLRVRQMEILGVIMSPTGYVSQGKFLN